MWHMIDVKENLYSFSERNKAINLSFIITYISLYGYSYRNFIENIILHTE